MSSVELVSGGLLACGAICLMFGLALLIPLAYSGGMGTRILGWLLVAVGTMAFVAWWALWAFVRYVS